ncbi:hypothetical protein BH11VER1_BH11VER1_22370 [soil metagenome]
MIKAQQLRLIFTTMVGTLGVALALGHWQTKTLRDDVASLTAKCQFLEGKVANAETAIARGEIAIKALDEIRMKIIKEPQRYTSSLLHTVKLGFNDIQHQVAAGRFPGLALTDGYMEMKKILDNPAFEEILAADHRVPVQ